LFWGGTVLYFPKSTNHCPSLKFLWVLPGCKDKKRKALKMKRGFLAS
jgi:hypothetical protein